MKGSFLFRPCGGAFVSGRGKTTMRREERRLTFINGVMGGCWCKCTPNSPYDRLFALGNDIAMEILCRLPVKSLFRFKCVSKKWSAVISEPSFASEYQSRSKGTIRLNGFVYQLHMSELFHCSAGGAVKVHFIPDDDKHEAHASAIHGNLITVKLLGRSVIFVDSHSGLLLCCDTKTCPSHYYLCNPLTKKWVALPDPPKRLFSATAKLLCLDQDHFRVYRILSCKSLSSVIDIETFYSEQGVWKEITLSLTHPTFGRPRRCPTLLGETIYWIDNVRTYAYHTQEERLEHLLLPVGSQAAFKSGCLWASGGSLYYAEVNNDVFRMWLLSVDCNTKDHNNAIWTLKHTATFSMLIQHQPDIKDRCNVRTGITGTCSVQFQPLALHHDHPHLVFFKLSGMVIRCDLKEKKLKVVLDGNVDMPPAIEDCQSSLPSYVIGTWAFPVTLPIWPLRIPVVKNALSSSF